MSADQERHKALTEMHRVADQVEAHFGGDDNGEFKAFIRFTVDAVERFDAEARQHARRHGERRHWYASLIVTFAEEATVTIENYAGS